MSLRFPSSRRKRPSAMGLRQMFPVQTKRTLFTIAGRARGPAENLKSNALKSTRASCRISNRSYLPNFSSVIKSWQGHDVIACKKNSLPPGVAGANHCGKIRSAPFSQSVLARRTSHGGLRRSHRSTWPPHRIEQSRISVGERTFVARPNEGCVRIVSTICFYRARFALVASHNKREFHQLVGDRES